MIESFIKIRFLQKCMEPKTEPVEPKTAPKTALLGLHDDLVEKTFARAVRSKGYKIESTGTIDEMLARCAERRYDLYLMDLNLGVYGGNDITPARRVYQALQEQGIEGLEGKFYGISGSDAVVKAARKEGIPAYDKVGVQRCLKEA